MKPSVKFQRSGRKKEANLIRRANRAAAVGRLMLGEFNTWQEFLKAEITDLESLPRRYLKAGTSDIKERLSPEIRKFCSKNFQGMDEKKLSLLYEDIKAYRGLELPLTEFEKKFAPLKRETLRGNPDHLTVCISLWGLQFRFPEDELSKDLLLALQIASEEQEETMQYKEKTHPELEAEKTKISSVVRKKVFAARSAILCCFNLMEAYLNGLAWDYVQIHDISQLSNRKRVLLEDTSSVSIRDKLKKYPKLLTGEELWEEPDQDLDGFIDTLKPFRDSLVHPSPFSAPPKFGGYDKLRLFYRIDYDTAMVTANLLINLIERIHKHVYCDRQTIPAWILELKLQIEQLDN